MTPLPIGEPASEREEYRAATGGGMIPLDPLDAYRDIGGDAFCGCVCACVCYDELSARPTVPNSQIDDNAEFF